jgi:hypothetical protein
MTTKQTMIEAGKRFAATASGRALKAEDHEVDSDGVVKPRQASIGIKDNVSEHEGERLNPGQQGGGSAIGAPPGKPSDPSNSA